NLPAPTSTSHSFPGHVQILFHATKPQHKNRGLGRLLTRCIILATQASGYKFTTVSVVDKGVMGYWHGKLGFLPRLPENEETALLGTAIRTEGERYLKAQVLIFSLRALDLEDTRPAEGIVEDALAKLRLSVALGEPKFAYGVCDLLVDAHHGAAAVVPLLLPAEPELEGGLEVWPAREAAAAAAEEEGCMPMAASKLEGGLEVWPAREAAAAAAEEEGCTPMAASKLEEGVGVWPAREAAAAAAEEEGCMPMAASKLEGGLEVWPAREAAAAAAEEEGCTPMAASKLEEGVGVWPAREAAAAAAEEEGCMPMAASKLEGGLEVWPAREAAAAAAEEEGCTPMAASKLKGGLEMWPAREAAAAAAEEGQAAVAVLPRRMGTGPCKVVQRGRYHARDQCGRPPQRQQRSPQPPPQQPHWQAPPFLYFVLQQQAHMQQWSSDSDSSDSG
ncbi:hypothetical protein Vafri_15971, partial [Volvox africanus]